MFQKEAEHFLEKNMNLSSETRYVTFTRLPTLLPEYNSLKNTALFVFLVVSETIQTCMPNKSSVR